MNFPDEENTPLRPDFVAALKRSREQAQKGEGIDLETFRKQFRK